MKKIVLLGCENSHSTQFASYVRDDKKYSDVDIDNLSFTGKEYEYLTSF